MEEEGEYIYGHAMPVEEAYVKALSFKFKILPLLLLLFWLANNRAHVLVLSAQSH